MDTPVPARLATTGDLTARNNIDRLVSRFIVTSEGRHSQNALAKHLSALSADEIEHECMMGLEQWLAVSLAHYEKERIRTLVQGSGPVVLTAVYLETLVSSWDSSAPSSLFRSCIETTVEILLTVAGKKRKRFRAVQDEFLASFLLCVAAASLKNGTPILEAIEYQAGPNNIKEDVLTSSAFYTSLMAMDHLTVDAMVWDARQRFLDCP